MTWIDDRQAEQRGWEDNKYLINAHAEDIYNDLWREITNQIGDAFNKGIRVFTNGAPLKRVVWLSVLPSPNREVGKRKELHISLAKEKLEIIVSGDTTPSKLLLDVCDDHVVCLKYNGKQISIHDAAIAILGPFLFPDLP